MTCNMILCQSVRFAEADGTNDRPKHTFALLRVLAEAIEASYIDVVLET
jgi:hypothetical protein